MNALSNRSFSLYFFSNTVSLFGLWIQKIGVGWLTWEITESTFWTSFVTLALMAPAGVLGPFFAVFAENWNMRVASVILKILMFLIGILIWFLQYLDQHTLFTLAFLSVLQGLLSACYHPVRLVFVSIVVPKNLLSSAVGLNSASFNGSRVVGPAFAGGLIAFFNLEVTFLIAALTYVPLIPVLIYMPLRTRIKKEVLQGNFFHRFLEGGKFAVRTPIILKSLFVVFVSAFFVRGMLEIQPTIAGEILKQGSFGLSLITTTAGIGALLASIWIGFRNSNKSKIETKLVSMLMLGLIISCIIGFISEVYTMAIFFTVVGFTTTAVGIGTQTIIQLEVEEVYRARVLTWWSSISFGSLTVGGIILGFSPLNTLLIASSITVIYSMLGGFKGVVYTDFFQFILAMSVTIWSAFYFIELPEIQSLNNLLTHPSVVEKLDLIPDLSDREVFITIFVLPLAVQWWSVWYPGAEPGGGGYIAQRMLSAKDENNAIWAVSYTHLTLPTKRIV